MLPTQLYTAQIVAMHRHIQPLQCFFFHSLSISLIWSFEKWTMKSYFGMLTKLSSHFRIWYVDANDVIVASRPFKFWQAYYIYIYSMTNSVIFNSFHADSDNYFNYAKTAKRIARAAFVQHTNGNQCNGMIEMGKETRRKRTNDRAHTHTHIVAQS